MKYYIVKTVRCNSEKHSRGVKVGFIHGESEDINRPHISMQNELIIYASSYQCNCQWEMREE